MCPIRSRGMSQKFTQMIQPGRWINPLAQAAAGGVRQRCKLADAGPMVTADR